MAMLSIRIDDNLRKGAEQAFNAMGLSLVDGVRSYLTPRASTPLPEAWVPKGLGLRCPALGWATQTPAY